MRARPRRRRRSLRSLPAVAAVLAVTAGCGAASTGSHAQTTATRGGGARTATLDSHTGPYGRILVTGSGTTLYLLTADPRGRSVCTGTPCTTVWPPFVSAGAPKLGSGLRASLVGETTRPDGTRQVTYAGHPLYTFVPGGVTKKVVGVGGAAGQGLQSFGGTWWVVSAGTGRAIRTKPH